MVRQPTLADVIGDQAAEKALGPNSPQAKRSPALVQLVAIRLKEPAPVAIMFFVIDDFQSVKVEPTDENIQAEIDRQPYAADVISWRRIEPLDLPQHRWPFRDAWRDDGEVIVTDIAIARQIWQGVARSARFPLLAELDGQWMRAMGQGKKAQAAAIEEKRQALRDAPQEIATATKRAKTAEAVMFWPKQLGPKPVDPFAHERPYGLN